MNGRKNLGVSDLRLDISANNEPRWDIYISKSKFRCWQPETNQILNMEDVVIVSWLAKHFAFFLTHPVHVTLLLKINAGDNERSEKSWSFWFKTWYFG